MGLVHTHNKIKGGV